jgi:hypothetical protein
MTVDAATNAQAAWRAWPQELERANGWAQQYRQLRRQVIGIGEKRGKQNEATQILAVSGKLPEELEPYRPPADVAVRQHTAREEQRRLASINKHATSVFTQALFTRSNLRIIDPKDDTYLAAHKRQWKREFLRTMKDEAERIKAVQENQVFRRAALEEDITPEEVGISPSIYKQLREDELRRLYPNEMAATDQAFLASEIFEEAYSAVKRAVENELVASGTTVEEPASSAPPAQTWE